MESSSIIEIKIFNGNIFDLWKLKMEDLLMDQEQWTTFCPVTQPTGMSMKEREKIERKERSTIQCFVADLVMLNVLGEYSVKKLWDKLGSLYQLKYLVNKLFLRKKLYLLRLSDGSSVNENLNSFNTMLIQLSSLDISIIDEDKCINLLCSFSDSWDSIFVDIGSNITKLAIEDVVSSLLSE
jgi:hypothetical protein